MNLPHPLESRPPSGRMELSGLSRWGIVYEQLVGETVKGHFCQFFVTGGSFRFLFRQASAGNNQGCGRKCLINLRGLEAECLSGLEIALV